MIGCDYTPLTYVESAYELEWATTYDALLPSRPLARIITAPPFG